MDTLVQTVIFGIGAGSIDALLALGIVLVYRTTGVLNFAQASVGIIGAYVISTVAPGRPLILAVSAGLLAATAASLATQIAIGGTRSRTPALTGAVATLAVAILLQQAVRLIWGSAAGTFPAPFGGGAFTFGSIAVPYLTAAATAVALVLAVLLGVALGVTRVGTMIRGVAEAPEAARLCGAPVGILLALVWAGAGILSGVAAFFAAQFVFDPSFLDPFFLASLVAAVIGGLRSLSGAFAGAVCLEVARNLFQAYAPNTVTPYVQTFLVVALVVVLILMPRRWLSPATRAV